MYFVVLGLGAVVSNRKGSDILDRLRDNESITIPDDEQNPLEYISHNTASQ